MEDRQTETIATIPFEFTGKASEYFKIWVVNILLTILTLGIYSAWAKVRRKRYFYGNTLLQDSPFEYLAEPMQILKGRLIAFGIFVIYAIVNHFRPLVAGLLALAFLGLFPWLVIKAHMFNARYSSYRNIRFDFKANYGKALAVHIGLPMLSVLTLGLAYPAYMYHRSRFLVAHSGYGTAPFSFSATAGNFYIVYLKAILIFFAGTVLFAALAMALGMLPLMAGQAAPEAGRGLTALLWFVIALGGVLLYLTVRAYVDTSIANLVWSNVGSNSNRFKSTLTTPYMLWLYLSNAVAIMFSLGLLIPWAQIRMTRYRLENIRLLAASDLAGFVAHQQDKVVAAGEEISDFFDFDIGI